MAFVTLGVVSNSWTELLPGSSLLEQCCRAKGSGYGYVELRQRGLGECEERVKGDDRPWPLPNRLAELMEAVPELRFNLAVEAPFLTTPVSAQDPYLQRCVEAALALSIEAPVLRLVDLSPAPSALEDEHAIDELGESVEDLARQLWRRGVRLALENSRQPLRALRAVIRRAALRLPEHAPSPLLCWDPHNQISQTFLPEDPVETARTLPVEELFEIHFKQGGPGALEREVGDGPLDWRALLAALRARGYRGPALFEIPAGEDIWERLERSTDYIRALLQEISPE
jgi:sugar phosphate isomerase/epimerase